MEKIVESLLFSFDCVILPGFGGFVAQKTNATIHPTGLFIYPSSKTIAFNKHLNQNDGLLVNKLSLQKNISFDLAQEEVENFVISLISELDKNKKYSFGKIGSFVLDSNKNIEFIPFTKVNFLLDSYGLPFLQLQTVSQELPSRSPINIPNPKVEKKTRSIKKWIPAMVSLPVAISIIAWPFLNHSTKQGFSNESGFAFFQNEEGIYSQRISTSLPEIPTRNFIIESIPTAVTVSPIADNSSNNNTQNNSIESSQWMLIVGCFQLQENANNLVNELISKGFDAKIAGTAPNGLIRVSAGSGANRQDLESAFTKAKQNGLDVWWHQAN